MDDQPYAPPKEDEAYENGDIDFQRNNRPLSLMIISILFILYGSVVTYFWVIDVRRVGFHLKDVRYLGIAFAIIGYGLMKGMDFYRIWAVRLAVMLLLLYVYIFYLIIEALMGDLVEINDYTSFVLTTVLPPIILIYSIFTLRSDRVMNYTFEK